MQLCLVWKCKSPFVAVIYGLRRLSRVFSALVHYYTITVHGLLTLLSALTAFLKGYAASLPYQCCWRPANVLISHLVPFHSHAGALHGRKVETLFSTCSRCKSCDLPEKVVWYRLSPDCFLSPCVAVSSSVVPIPGTFSWPLVARGKPRRGMLRRAVFSDVQRKALEKMFQKQKYISKPDRKKLASKLGLKDSQVRFHLISWAQRVIYARHNLPHSPSSPRPQVKIWFQNRRMKWRNSKERELLSTGGCREQTLPTKTNPHPDLSDVGKKSSAEDDDEEELGGERMRASRPSIPSATLFSKHSDFSESDDEEITVS